ncbi:hypothetical protein ACP7OL_000577 [Salmonella enterica subsp. enterica]
MMPEHRLRAVDSTGYNPSAAIGGGGGGDEMLGPRVARLESDVEHIKVSLADIRADLRVLSGNSSIMQRDTAVIIQKLVDIETAISKKPNVDYIESQIVKCANKQIIWAFGILLALFSAATGIILRFMA